MLLPETVQQPHNNLGTNLRDQDETHRFYGWIVLEADARFAASPSTRGARTVVKREPAGPEGLAGFSLAVRAATSRYGDRMKP
ncbi:MAG: hypothetical protein JO056_09320 [Alphaproteobacteria bacterium]|nr:hypothetical protein [Alphaproteobacteria bacterium]